MKTKTFLLLCFLLGMGLSQLSAQLKWNVNEEGTGTLITTLAFNDFGIAVYCDGQQVDLLTGTVTTHNIYRFKNWVYWGANEHYFGGDFKSTWTDSDEVFNLMEKDHGFDIIMDGDVMVSGTDIYHFNIIGNKGTHYVGSIEWDIPTQTISSVIRADCH
jgi:hypothetical protein